jgi:hypothetical protein
MNTAPDPSPLDAAAALEAEVDQALALCDGDARAAIRALIVALRHVEEEAHRLNAAVSRGYVRGDLYRRLMHSDRLAGGHSGER